MFPYQGNAKIQILLFYIFELKEKQNQIGIRNSI